MAKLNESDFRDWQDGQGNVMTSRDYKQERSMIIVANNDNDKRITDHQSSGDHDNRYYTQTQLDNGQLDTRYYTVTEVDTKLSTKTDKTGDHQGTWQGFSPTQVDQTLMGRMSTAENQIGNLSNNLSTIIINALYPPAPLTSAKGDGVTDDTVAIQNIINYVGQNGGGKIILPGQHVICPQSNTATFALSINYDNIEICGNSSKSKLIFKVSGLRSPQTNWNLDGSGAVLRGHGIYIYGSSDQNAPRKNIYIHDIEIDGGCHKTGVNTYPANPTTGDGWDTTNHGIEFQANYHFDTVRLERVNLHGFLGELFYGGSQYTKNIIANDCDIHDTNGNGISFFGDGALQNNRIYDCSASGYEGTQPVNSGRLLIKGNKIWNCGLSAISPVASVLDTNIGTVMITQNTINACYHGIVLNGVKNVDVIDNTIIDTGTIVGTTRAISVLNSVSYQTAKLAYVANIKIKENKILADTLTIDSAIFVNVGTRSYDTLGAGRRIVVKNNIVTATAYGSLNSKSVTVPLTWSGDLKDSEVGKNTFAYVTNGKNINLSVTNFQMTGTSYQPFSFRPFGGVTVFDLKAYVRNTGTTTANVGIQIQYTDSSNTVQTKTVSISCPQYGTFVTPITFEAIGTAGQFVYVTFTTDQPNATFISAGIVESFT